MFKKLKQKKAAKKAAIAAQRQEKMDALDMRLAEIAGIPDIGQRYLAYVDMQCKIIEAKEEIKKSGLKRGAELVNKIGFGGLSVGVATGVVLGGIIAPVAGVAWASMTLCGLMGAGTGMMPGVALIPFYEGIGEKKEMKISKALIGKLNEVYRKTLEEQEILREKNLVELVNSSVKQNVFDRCPEVRDAFARAALDGKVLKLQNNT